MSTFERKFTLNEHLNGEASTAMPDWWQELLAGIASSGRVLCDNNKLRVAVRNNYLNFYHYGQSIAKVRYDRQKQPYAETHVKYVFENENEQNYARLTGDQNKIIHPKNPELKKTYEKGDIFNKWIKESGNYSGEEKTFVEQLVAANANIIDLEMAISGKNEVGRSVANRLDLVALEDREGEVKIVFWEAKLASDKRCKSRDGEPEVLSQIAKYKVFLEDADRQKEIIKAYSKTCKILVELSTLAKTNGNEQELGTLITKIANGDIQLSVDPMPRLIILNDSGESWQPHGDKLRAKDVVFQVMEQSAVGADRILSSKAELNRIICTNT